ncbi:FtsK/SpoIIIE domain-containing protein [Streptomyces sp. YIM 98790]|uniref:FtsK/SpoIIIE domain-containing protein n=1 Tax=Streptomyces sp. YIM 98790 TaxID=2689077 RepID=UPI0028BEE562|nr:FtsK/SpoIIIE domain-containing protein [Streptomyces sp. YIM 98790]
MKHEEDGDEERELFARLEADMRADGSADRIEMVKTRSSGDGSADPSPDRSAGRGPIGSADPVALVDGPAPADPSLFDRLRQARRRPVVPAWARSRAGLIEAAGWLGGYAWHVTAFHAVRVPVYGGRLALRSPAGLARLAGALGRWLRDAEGAPLRRLAAEKGDAAAYIRLTGLRNNRVRLRTMLFLLASVAGAGLALALWVLAPGWLLAAAAACVAVLGWAGAPADAPVVHRAVETADAPRLTSEMVVKAMASIGISQITSEVAKGRDGIRFVSPIVREGPGWRADIDLPPGVTPADVLDRRPRLASALRRPLGCVWPEANAAEHEGRLVLWVGDRDLSKAGAVRWQLAQARRHDIFARIPFGIDPRGRGQSVPMVQHNILIGSQPGQGKTSAVRVLACGAALDPSVELWLHENKGTGDLDELEHVSHRFVSGIDDESIGYAADSLARLRQEVMRRAAAMKRLPRDLCPDKRITREIADRRSLELWPLVAVFDECQNVFAHAAHGKQAGEDAEFVIKVGRALGVTLVLATQRPDKDSLPTGVSGNVSIRFCLRVGGQVENDMILGTSAYKNGIRATIFRPEADAGNGYLVGATSAPAVVRVAYLDMNATKEIGQRARRLREAAGTLSGHALGEGAAQAGPSYDLLADVLSVVPAREERVWNERIAARLAELRPEVYGGWEAASVTAALKPFGVRARDVAGTTDDGTRTTRRGIVREHLLKAIAEREGNQGDG